MTGLGQAAARTGTVLVRWGLLLVGCTGTAASLSKPVTGQIAYLMPAFTFGLVGWLLTRRRPENAEGWLFLTAWAGFGLFSLADLSTSQAVLRGAENSWWAWVGAWLANWLWPVLLVVATTLPLLVFPSGFASARWRWVGLAALASAGLAAVCGIIAPTLYFQDSDATLANPLSPGFLAGAGPSDDWPVRNAALLGVALTALLAAVSVVLRARRATGIEQLQFRWVALAVTSMAVLLVVLTLPTPWLSDTTFAGTLGWALALSLLPAAVGLAILRYRLYDIDRIISRTASYALVTGVLLAVYFVIVTSLTTLLPKSSNGFAVAAATLAAAAAFRPLLARVQKAVDRRFDRERYDGLRAAEAFSARLRDETDPDAVSAEMTAVVQRTLQPGRLLLWIPGDVADER